MDEALPLLPPRPVIAPKRPIALLEDLIAKPEGITSIEYPGVRVADSVFKLRRADVEIETLHEAHGGEFAGHHARYVRKSKIERVGGANG